jgi:two-component system, chemotaxis family, CheB/CheR fusion protein
VEPTSSSDDEPAVAATALDFPVVGVGASAGGLAAIKVLLEGLPAEPDMAFVIVLHLSPRHESNAAAILQTVTRMPVAQVQGRVRIERDHVYVIPPTHDLAMIDGALALVENDRPRGRHVVIDLFFRTLADAHRERAIGIVLSGTGSDGSAGIARLKEAGGIVISQSPGDAEYDGMPKSAIATGKVDIVLPVADIPNRLVEIWSNTRRIELPDAAKIDVAGNEPASPETAEEALREIMKLLQQRTGHDFRNYKRATVLRRIERRLQVNTLPDLMSYRRFLSGDADEARALLDDMLIGVTQFFRDRPAFEALEREVIPRLFESVPDDEAVRVWVPGCSSGEEAYSLAMLLAEEAARAAQPRRFSLFATDIDESAITAGRSGVYPEAIAADVAAPRLRAHFAAGPGGYRVSKQLRESVIFALHNVLRDPPFSRLDLASCRNLLIYLDRAAQQAVLEMFHFAIKPGGYLLLGTSETVDAASRLFTAVDKVNRIYRANPTGRPPRALQTLEVGRAAGYVQRDPGPPPTGRTRTPAEVHQELLEHVAPPSVLVTHEYEIVHISARAVGFLRFAEGEPTHNLIHAVRPELRNDLRGSLLQALQLHARVDAPAVRLQIEGRELRIHLAVQPVRHPAWPGEMLIVTFEQAEDAGEGGASEDVSERDPEVARLRGEVLRKSDQLRTTIEQYETSAEELKASNEELQAINEELRSATEELETSKEELQSTNEELITVNHELKTKIDETSEINDDLKNLISSTDIATIFVDPNMRIKRFTPAAAGLFNIIASDVGRPLFDITHKLEYAGLAGDARAVFATLKTIEREVTSTDGKRLLARLLPYRTTEDRIGGAVLTFVDVTHLRQAESALDVGRERMQLIAETMTDFAILTLDLEGRLTSWSPGATQLFGYAPGEAIGQHFDILFRPEERALGAPAEKLRIARETGRSPDERWMLRKDGSLFWGSGITVPLRAGDVEGYAKICRDMTNVRSAAETQARELMSAQRGAAEAAAESEQKSEFLAVMSHELKHPLNLINVNAQLLMTLPEAQALPGVMRAARTIQRTVQGQARIIDDLLDMSRSNVGKLAVNRVPLLLLEAIQPCMTWALAESRAKGVRLYAEGFDDPIQVDGDAVRVEQIAWNLLSNAIKFSRSGGSIVVRVSRDGDDALLEVTDSGRGIAPGFLPHVFEMFKQADALTTRGEGGLGIGLALVKNLAELHGGRVAAESKGVGHGSTFRVWLPLHQRTGFGSLDGVSAEPPRPLAGMRILLVDDTTDTLETFGYLLEHEGAVVTPAVSGAEALSLAASADFDLLVSDVGMPHMDGYQLVAELRRLPRTAALPAIALTGYGRPQDVQRALDAGFDAHVDKPVDFPHMREVIKAVISSAPLAGSLSEKKPRKG